MGKPKIVEYVSNEICSYGCNSNATVKFANGKLCCSALTQQCKAVSSKNSNKQAGNTNKSGKTQTAWNKGLTSKTDSRCARPDLAGKPCGAAIKGHTKETKEKLSAIMADKMQNRYTASRREEYNGVKFESSWEIKFAKSLDEHQVSWIRPAPLLYRDDADQLRRYYPDFYLPDFAVYLDPKNAYLQKVDKRKFELVIEQNNIVLFMLNEQQLDWLVVKANILKL